MRCAPEWRNLSALAERARWHISRQLAGAAFLAALENIVSPLPCEAVSPSRWCCEISPLSYTSRFIRIVSSSTNTTGRNDGTMKIASVYWCVLAISFNIIFAFLIISVLRLRKELRTLRLLECANRHWRYWFHSTNLRTLSNLSNLRTLFYARQKHGWISVWMIQGEVTMNTAKAHAGWEDWWNHISTFLSAQGRSKLVVKVSHLWKYNGRVRVFVVLVVGWWLFVVGS